MSLLLPCLICAQLIVLRVWQPCLCGAVPTTVFFFLLFPQCIRDMAVRAQNFCCRFPLLFLLLLIFIAAILK
uniref:Uncharacterized protein n=1 Tax=Amblyomma cajennense TaxID=34607 RepID=A0A023FB80_AMBCJ